MLKSTKSNGPWSRTSPARAAPAPRNLKTVQPDPKLFPDFDESLRAAMLKETEEYFATIMKEDRSILDFIDSDFTVLNVRMARFYKIKNFRPGKQDVSVKTTLTDGRRGGVLSQASVLTVTSNATRTSPVKRGKFVLEQFLGTPPPPPPPDVPELKDSGVDLKASLRKRMEQHRADPNCATCHAKMDPLGFKASRITTGSVLLAREGRRGGHRPVGRAPLGPVVRRPEGAEGDPHGPLGASLPAAWPKKMMTYALGRGLRL